MRLGLFLLVLLSGFAVPNLHADAAGAAVSGELSGGQGTPVAEARRLPSAPTIDGKLDDAAWQAAAVLGGFVQNNPDTGQPATQKTEVRLGYDAHSLYFGIRCDDSEPEKIVGPLLRRDGDLSFDDSVWIILDTYHDGRNGFLFATNPLGVQVDGLVRNEGEEQNLDWDGLWEVATSRDAHGWVAEIAIPFKTLRYPRQDPQVWGFNVIRFLARRKEESAWKPILHEWQRLSRYKISEYGELRGLADLERGGRYSLLPYALVRGRDDDRRGRSTHGEAGGDLKIDITSELVADLTANTDFAEAEADQQQVNLSRLKLYYPEKRQFFLEGASLFYFGDRLTVFDPPEPFVFFFSRQIGLAEDGQVEVPVLGGAKVSGSLDGVSVGLLNMTTDSKTFYNADGVRVTEPRTSYSVARLKTEIFHGSTLGLMGLAKEPAGDSPSNQGLGLDWLLSFGPRLSSQGFLARTSTPGLRGDDKAFSADLVYKGPVMRLGETWKDFGDDFNPEMGFIPRTGIRKSLTEGSWILVPDRGVIHQVSLIDSLDHVTDQRGNLQSQVGVFEVGVLNRSRAGMALIATDDVEVLSEPLEIYKGVVLPPGHYRFDHLFLGYASDYSRKVGCTLWYDGGEFWGGRRLRTRAVVEIKPLNGVWIYLDWDRSDVHLAPGDFVTELFQSTVTYALSPRLATRTTVQWNREDNFRGNFVVDWTYRPGSHLYLVYNDLRDLDRLRRGTGFSPLDPARSLTLKLTRRLDF